VTKCLAKQDHPIDRETGEFVTDGKCLGITGCKQITDAVDGPGYGSPTTKLRRSTAG
jgi:hypothetical protein